jgi:hypothetical protein
MLFRLSLQTAPSNTGATFVAHLEAEDLMYPHPHLQLCSQGVPGDGAGRHTALRDGGVRKPVVAELFARPHLAQLALAQAVGVESVAAPGAVLAVAPALAGAHGVGLVAVVAHAVAPPHSLTVVFPSEGGARGRE